MTNKKIKMNKSIRWLIEIGVWFLIFIFVANFILLVISKNNNQYNSYQIFMPDIYGVIVGSPVNMMGVPIGYVNKVKIIDNEVFVRFTLNKKDLKLPKGCVITVEFNGLGGSKSLEIYPPNEESKTRDEYLIVEEPKRLGKVVGLVDEMFDKISSITYRLSYCAKEVTTVSEEIKKEKGENKQKTNDKKNFLKILNETNKELDEKTNTLENLNNKIKRRN